MKKGEKGIQILAPIVGHRRRKCSDRNRTPSQEAKARPCVDWLPRRLCLRSLRRPKAQTFQSLSTASRGEVGDHRERLIAFLDEQNIKLEYNEKIAPALGVSYGGKIALLPGQSKAEKFTTLVHERRTSFCTRPSAAP